MSSSSSLPLVSQCTVFPDRASTLGYLKLSVSDLPMLSCHYIQKGCLFTRPSIPVSELVSRLKRALSTTLSQFPPLAGRLATDSQGYVYITCNDAGAEFSHAYAGDLHVRNLIGFRDVPEDFKQFFPFDLMVSYDGHFRPILAVRVTELADGVFIGCVVNHAVVDGTSFWNFFNRFADLSRGMRRISRATDFSRASILISPVVLRLPEGGPSVTFSTDSPVRERIFRFKRESIQALKSVVNARSSVEISSFQSLCALLWRGVTRARKLPREKMTTFRMAVNCRHRLEPRLEPLYFGNAIQSIPTQATAKEVLGKDLRWCAKQLNTSVLAHDNATVRRYVERWERDPRVFPLGNFDGAMITMGSSPRFPMYENDFGWGRPVAVRSGRANKFDGKISAFPGPNGDGTVDLEVVLAPNTMAHLLSDQEFMQYVSDY
ncbi:BAHD acyltransferase DCR-like [Salvia hispanica]|uniref:BAHD acyltransferase DCR-like n=1 Tax=Salvia hispanica TaxID=49212 RepID=UPI0020099794|nr:BAHD acyltransferase DCR-like [Salvia hispanica]